MTNLKLHPLDLQAREVNFKPIPNPFHPETFRTSFRGLGIASKAGEELVAFLPELGMVWRRIWRRQAKKVGGINIFLIHKGR